MADESIKKEFIDGINEVYSIMFTDGVNDGVYFYPLYEPETISVYREVKYKQYHTPVLLVAKVQIRPTQGEEDVKSIKGNAVFTVPVKSLLSNNIDVGYHNLDVLRKGLIKYKETFYEIDNIEPKTFVADTFMTYAFSCTEDLSISDETITVVTPPVEDDEEIEEGEDNVGL